MAVQRFKTPGKRYRRDNGEGGIYKRADGMWVGRLELPPALDGTRQRSKPVYSKDKAKVIDKLEELKRDIANGVGQPSKQLTVGEWMTHWVEEIARPRIGPDTWATYRAVIRNQINPFIGKRILVDLSTADVRALHKKILADRPLIRRGKPVIDEDGNPVMTRWSTRTAEQAHDVLNKALKDAMRERPPKVKFNVAELVEKPEVVIQDRKPLTSEQARLVLATSHAWGDPNFTRWAFAILTGSRQAECLGLTWDRINFDMLTVDLQWQLKRLKLKPGADPDDPNRFDVRPGVEFIPLWRGYVLRRMKTKKPRIVPLPGPLAVELLRYRETVTPNEFGLVWASESLGPIRPVDDDEAWYDALARADLPRVVLHGARHTTATLLQDEDVAESVRMGIMGHSSKAAQRGYAKVNLEPARKALATLDVLMPPRD